MTFFVLTCDLWDEKGTTEVNLVKHSSTSPSISTATATSYPPPASQQGPMPDPNWNPMLDTRAHPDAQRSQAEYYAQTYSRYDRMTQEQRGYHPHQPQHSQPYPQNPQYPHQNRIGSTQSYSNPSTYAYSPQHPPQSQYGYTYQSPVAQTPTNPYGQQGHGHPLPSPTSMHPSMPPPGMSPTMFTRNLIGSLSASAFRLTDPDNKVGVWFILQDLSVRTEGQFRYVLVLLQLHHSIMARLSFCSFSIHSLPLPHELQLTPPSLKMSFVNVGTNLPSIMGTNGHSSSHPATPTASTPTSGFHNPSTSSAAQPVLNQGSAPVLASVYSEPFQVFSAKKFPGVIESTPLSKCFALQGIKIPIRKDAKGSGRGSVSIAGDGEGDGDDDGFD
jgi:hypothetical protein